MNEHQDHLFSGDDHSGGRMGDWARGRWTCVWARSRGKQRMRKLYGSTLLLQPYDVYCVVMEEDGKGRERESERLSNY